MIEILATTVITLVCVAVGYYMGRKTVIIDGAVKAAPPGWDPGPADEAEGDYIGDEIPEYGITEGRTPTIQGPQ